MKNLLFLLVLFPLIGVSQLKIGNQLVDSFPRATFFKGWLAIGAIYNLTLKKTQATVGNPAALIPGLN
jgi:hypothetical protein